MGQALSEFGTQITFVAVPLQVYLITRSTAMVGLLALCESLPLVVLPLVGGAIADAVERRRFLMVAQAVAAGLSLALAVNALLPEPRVWVLFAFSFLWASAYSLYSPAFRAWPARLLPPDLYTSALALEVVYYQSAALVGPALAGVVFVTFGVEYAYLIDVLSYAAVIVALAGMRRSPPTAERASVGWSTIVDGLRFLRGRQVLQGTFWIDLNAMIFGLPVALFPAFVIDVLDASPAAVLVCCTRQRRWGPPRRVGQRPCEARPATGARHDRRVCVLGRRHHRVRLLIDPVGRDRLPDAGERVRHGERPLPRRDLEDRHARRDAGPLEGVSLAVVGTGPSLGNAEAGLLASLTSVRFSIVSGGIACILGAGVLAILLPKYRRYDAAQPVA